MRTLRAVVCVALLSSQQFLAAQHCGGKERWAVKDGTDAAAQQIDFSSIAPMTVAQLLQLPEPQIPNDDTTRVVPDETRLYRVNARLVKWKHECCKATDDNDYHLVMTDDTEQYSDESANVPVTGHSFVAEMPDPNCLSGRTGNFGTTSPFLDQNPTLNIRGARAALESKFPNPVANGQWNEAGGIPVEIIGVGFFDRAHKQTGRAPNNLEIHPILAINFNPGVPQPQPLIPQPPPQPSGVAVQWEYQMITANNATDLTTEANTLGAQGWEMVGVVLDASRPDKYVGYLKRKK